VKRGEIWLAALDPTVGAEIQKTRPVLVVSPDELNERLRTAIIAPLTSGSHPARFRIPVKFKGVDGLILGDQIRNVDRKRFIKRLGEVEAGTLSMTLAMLAELFAE